MLRAGSQNNWPNLPLSHGQFDYAIILRSVIRDCCRAVHVQSHRIHTRTTPLCFHRRSHINSTKAGCAVSTHTARYCPTQASATRALYTLPDLTMPRACANGCGWTEFGTHSTCCTRCKGSSGPHTRDCHSKNSMVADADVVTTSAGVPTCRCWHKMTIEVCIQNTHP